jgi:hypothetical protein
MSQSSNLLMLVSAAKQYQATPVAHAWAMAATPIPAGLTWALPGAVTLRYERLSNVHEFEVSPSPACVLRFTPQSAQWEIVSGALSASAIRALLIAVAVAFPAEEERSWERGDLA